MAPRMFAVDEAVKAHKALRAALNLGPETFPVEAFVGMISDEVETLRDRGMSVEAIAQIIRANSNIDVSAQEIQDNYATSDARRGAREGTTEP